MQFSVMSCVSQTTALPAAPSGSVRTMPKRVETAMQSCPPATVELDAAGCLFCARWKVFAAASVAGNDWHQVRAGVPHHAAAPAASQQTVCAGKAVLPPVRLGQSTICESVWNQGWPSTLRAPVAIAVQGGILRLRANCRGVEQQLRAVSSQRRFPRLATVASAAQRHP